MFVYNKNKIMDEKQLEEKSYEEVLDLENQELSSRVNHYKKLLLAWLFPVSYNPWDLIDYMEEHRAANNTDYRRKDIV